MNAPSTSTRSAQAVRPPPLRAPGLPLAWLPAVSAALLPPPLRAPGLPLAWLSVVSAALLGACGATSPAGPPPRLVQGAEPPGSVLPARQPLGPGEIELGESHPVETSLGDPNIPPAHATWLAMIAAARRSLDVAQFYVASRPATRMQAVLDAIRAAGARGVRVRLLVDRGFCATYPRSIGAMEGVRGVEVRRWDAAPTLGGILHAKYFVVDGERAWLGSQNFDWRSLTHIQELGLRLRVPRVVAGLRRVFELDWALAGGSRPATSPPSAAGDDAFAAGVFRGAPVQIALRASPRAWLPAPASWDLPHLIALVDGARRRVRIQLLSYHNHGPQGRRIGGLEGALRRAGARGVRVQVLLSHWARRPGRLADARRLAALPGVRVRLLEVPEASGGPIPFARVIHAKYMVVDGRAAWIGTSNWGWRYFHRSRNVGVEVRGGAFAAALDRFFERGWTHPAALSAGGPAGGPRVPGSTAP